MKKTISYRNLVVLCIVVVVLGACSTEPKSGTMRLALGEFAQTVCEADADLRYGGQGACTLQIQVYNGPIVNSEPGTLFDSGCVSYAGEQLTLSNFPTGTDLTLRFNLYSDSECSELVARGARGGVSVSDSASVGTWCIPTFEVEGFRTFPEFSADLVAEVAATSCTEDADCTDLSPIARCEDDVCSLPDNAYPLNLGTPRAFHAATTLPDGRIVLTGGLGRSLGDDQWIATDEPVEVFDPSRLVFERTEIAGVSDLRMAMHNAVGLDDGRVVAIGGVRQAQLTLVDVPVLGENAQVLSVNFPATDSTQTDNLLQLAVEFDLKTNEAIAGALTQPRVGGSSTKLDDGSILVSGGAVGAGDGVVPSKFADRCTFDSEPDCSAEGALNSGRAGHCAVCRDEDCSEVLLIGGLPADEKNFADNLFEVYADGDFSPVALKASDLESNVLFSSCVKVGPDIFLAGGQSGRNRPPDIVPVGIGELDDGYAGIKLGSPVTPTRAHAATVVMDDSAVFVTGGINNQGRAVADCYFIRGGVVEPLTAGLQQPRFGHTATVLETGPLKGAVLIAGGFVSDANGDLQLATSAELYVP